MFKSCEKQKAHADYIEDIANNPTAILNFNQLFDFNNANPNNASVTKQDNTFVLNNTPATYISLLSFSWVSGNTYFLYVNSSSDQIRFYNEAGFWFDTWQSRIITLDSNATGNLYIHTNRQISGSIQVYIVNLTSMFGQNNEPNLQQCKDLFTANYYNYTTGTPMTLSGIDSYTNGYTQGLNALLQNTEFVISSQEFYNSVFTVNLNDNYGCTAIDEESNTFTKNSSEQSVTLYGTNIKNDSACICLPFKYTLPRGTQITISGKASNTAYHNAMRVYIGFWVNSAMYQLETSMPTGTQGYFTSSSMTFLLPFDVDRMYIITPADGETGTNIKLKDFEVGYYLTGIDSLTATSFIDGYNKAEEYYKSYYQIGGTGYNEIYQTGVRDSESGMSVFQDSWAFMGSVFSGFGDLLTVEFFPGLPIGIFVAFPLLLGLIFFIVKLSKGGG